MLYELIDLTDWKKSKECIAELSTGGIRIDERQLRKLVEVNNINFVNHETDTFIAHGSRGYKATKNREEIIASLNDKTKRAVSMLRENRKVMQALSENNNLKFDLDRKE